MPTFYSNLHEEKLEQGMHEFEYDVSYAGGTKSYHYLVSFDAMTQKKYEQEHKSLYSACDRK